MFKGMNLNESIVEALKIQSITIPTEIQIKSIPKAMDGKDIIIQSETGTGKTLAYLLPLYHKIDTSKKEMQAIVLVPTHELAIQILRQIEQLSQNSNIKAVGMPVIGNVNIKRQIEKLKEKPHIIVGSPGRILELIKMKKIQAHTVKTIIIDEADRLMDDNNSESVQAVIKSTLRERQLIICSATIPQKIIDEGNKIMKEPELIRVEEELKVPDTIEHMFFKAEKRDKVEVLRKLVRILEPRKAIVFVNKNDDIDLVAAKLQYHDIKAESIHGANIKLDRKKAMDDFRAGKLQLLIASDIAARGLDIQDITHVFSFSIPEDPRDYLHRVGRTGRAGNKGMAVAIATDGETALIRKFEKVLNIRIAAKDTFKGEIVDAVKTVSKK